MVPNNVTLIVKAPNQQIEDQNVECQSTWTVHQLKSHLAEVYPSKPKTEEQKIIYSGQLLDDESVLKDVLRTYDSQNEHTMHLVCTPSKRIQIPQKSSPQRTVPEIGTDGLRQRTTNTTNATSPSSPTEARPEMRQNDQNHTVEMQNYLTSFVNNYGRVPPYPNYNMGEGYLPVPNDPAALANHMMMMQQAYLQYMQQYANMWQATAAATAPPAPPAETPPPTPAPQPEEVEDHHDWLDQLYAASRIGILVSLIYLYGSPTRLLLVLLLGGVAFLHQIGFFRELQLQQVNEVQPNEPVADHQPANEQPNDGNIPNDNNEAAPNEQPTASGANTTNVNPDNHNQQSYLAVGWMIFTTFFSSLIPEANH
ncbi:hypothetical protein ACJJTC_004198 [Scirpophaga incertulas]